MPILSVIAGPNGSGKSTLISKLQDEGVNFGRYFNADDIAKELGGSGPQVAQQAQEIVRQGRAEALASGVSHSFETVMSHLSHIEYMREAQAKGFEVRLYFVATDKPEVNVQRVANRVLNGGHDVPIDRIISRYHRCLGNLPDAISASDCVLVFDNSQANRPHRELAWIHRLELRHSKAIMRDGPELIPAWWLSILLQIKPINPFENGSIA